MSDMNAAHWANVTEVGAAWGIRALLLLYKVFGRALLYVALYPVVTYFFLTNGFARAASSDYLRRLARFAPDTLVRPTRATTFRHFLSFATSIYDRVGALSGHITLDDLSFTGREAMVEMMEKGQGGVLVTAHLGSLEVCRAMASLRAKARLNVLVHTQHARMINRAMQRVDADAHVELIEVERARIRRPPLLRTVALRALSQGPFADERRPSRPRFTLAGPCH